MSAFLVDCGLVFAAAVLLVSGCGHALDPRRFAGLLRQHGVLPGRLAPVLAFAIVVLELGVAALAMVAIVGGDRRWATVALAGCAGLGLAFVSYLRSLIRRGRNVDCACSPFAGNLTPASFVPGGLLAVFGLLGLVAQAAGAVGVADGAAVRLETWGAALAAVWGLTLALLAFLLPASAPGNAELVRPLDSSLGGANR